MSRQWMYMANWRSKEFIDGVHEFIEVAEKHKYGGFVRCPCKFYKNEKDYSSSRTIHSYLFNSGSCPTTMFGPSMEKEELCWITMKKKRTGFLTLQAITEPFLMTLQFNLFRNQSLINSIYFFYYFQYLFKNGLC